MSFIFGKPKGPPPVEEIDLSEDARELRRRIVARGGEVTTLLAGRTATARGNVFKKNLAGTSKSRR